MRVQCDVCEKNKAAVMCCADEAALCTSCDTRVHAANKLANKHVRVPLVGQLESPKCDICQEKTGFFFCLEDRALLCRDCDVSIHTANKLSSNHQRFLITGTRVGLEAVVCGQKGAESVPEESPRATVPKAAATSPPSKGPSPSSVSKISTITSHKPESVPSPATPASSPSWLSNAGRNQERERTKPAAMTSANVSEQQHQAPAIGRRSSIPADFLSNAVPVWGVDELLNLPELADGYHMGDIGSSKADMNNLGDYDWMADLSMFEEQMYAESFHEVPQMFAPAPTVPMSRGGKASALSKGKAKQDAAIVPNFDDTFVVPDLGLLSSPGPVAKRRRTHNES